MGRTFFLLTDPVKLDRYTNHRPPRRRRKPLALVRELDGFKRSLQCLPRRELQILYQSQVLHVQQDDIADLLLVRQTNCSYRLQRAQERLKLHHQIRAIGSETRCRAALLAAGVSQERTLIALGILRTLSMSTVARSLNVKPSHVRHSFDAARRSVEAHVPTTPEETRDRQTLLQMMDLAQANWNQLMEIEPQGRFAWKRGRTPPSTPTKSRGPRVIDPTKDDLQPRVVRRSGTHRYTWVQQRHSQAKPYQAKIGRDLFLGSFENEHLAALATNLAVRLLKGPQAPPINTIPPEHAPSPDEAHQVLATVREALQRRNLPIVDQLPPA